MPCNNMTTITDISTRSYQQHNTYLNIGTRSQERSPFEDVCWNKLWRVNEQQLVVTQTAGPCTNYMDEGFSTLYHNFKDLSPIATNKLQSFCYQYTPYKKTADISFTCTTTILNRHSAFKN